MGEKGLGFRPSMRNQSLIDGWSESRPYLQELIIPGPQAIWTGGI